MAVQFNYVAKKGWKPKNPDEDYLIAYFQIALKDGIPQEKFKEVAATVAAESSTGTWTEVDESSNAGMDNATKYRAVVFDIEEDQKRFKIAYPVNLFEPDNMSGMLAGFAGNIGGMKALKGMRLLDVRFPKKIVQSFPGPKFGIEGMRDMLGHYDDLDDPLRKKMPIMGTVPKPKVGRTAEQQSALARELWTAGDFTYDFIKDETAFKFALWIEGGIQGKDIQTGMVYEISQTMSAWQIANVLLNKDNKGEPYDCDHGCPEDNFDPDLLPGGDLAPTITQKYEWVKTYDDCVKSIGRDGGQLSSEQYAQRTGIRKCVSPDGREFTQGKEGWTPAVGG